MVLLPFAEPPAGTLAAWYAEVASYERSVDGHVQRGGRWLQRLERAREARWLASVEAARSGDGAAGLAGAKAGRLRPSAQRNLRKTALSHLVDEARRGATPRDGVLR